MIEKLVGMTDEDIIKVKEYCDKELNKRLYWLRKGLQEAH